MKTADLPGGVDISLQEVLRLPADQQDDLRHLLKIIEEAERREACSDDFLEFVKHVWPAFI